MLLIGLKTETTGVGHTENDWGSVSHQKMDIILEAAHREHLVQHYEVAKKKALESQKKLQKLNEELEFSDMSEEEYEKLYSQYSKDIQILKYDKVLIIEGGVLK